MKRFYAVAALTALLFSACSTQDDVPTPPLKPVKLEFASVVKADAERITPMTRAEVDFKESFKVNLSAVDGVYVAATGKQVDWNGTKFDFVAGDEVYLLKTARNLTAWAPATLDHVADQPNTFALTAGAYQKTNDLLYQQNTSVSAENASVAISFQRAYAMLTFKLSAANYHGAKKMTALAVYGIPKTGTIDIATGTVTADAALADLAAPIDAVTAETDFSVADASAGVLVVPVASFTDMKIKCTLDGQTYQDIAITGVGFNKLEKGKNYEITLTIEDTGLTFSGVKENEWDDVAGAGSGTLQ